MKKLLALMVVAAVASLAGLAAPTTATPPARSLVVYVAAGEPTVVDELEPGLGAGDWLLFRDPVLDAEGQQIGHAITRAQLIAPAGGEDIAFILDCTIELPQEGRLVFTGAELISHLETATRYAVVGGTGRFAGSEGQVTGEPAVVGDREATRLTFELTKK
jgi:hypothetical protein